MDPPSPLIRFGVFELDRHHMPGEPIYSPRVPPAPISRLPPTFPWPHVAMTHRRNDCTSRHMLAALLTERCKLAIRHAAPSAAEGLGLKLEAGKRLIDTIVIDHVGRPAPEN
jgi:hypothetical protein